MNDEMRLARVDLGEGWIDLGYGEPVVVLDTLLSVSKFDFSIRARDLQQCRYQPPQGNKELVELLEKKYGAKVVITNGAKQGMAAVCYALSKAGHKAMMIHAPYWTSTPTIIKDQGLNVEFVTDEEPVSTSFMLTNPNNPDGKELTREEIEDLVTEAKTSGVKLIHDAAYYTPIYVADPSKIFSFGDAQIYSFSKMYGMSGLRIGYVVLHDESLLPGVIEFVERSCSGVSTASQDIALRLERHFENVPYRKDLFESMCRTAIAKSREELKNLNPEVLIPEQCDSNSMFAWCKVGPKFDAKAVKVNVLDGSIFGRPGYVRLNIAMKSDLIRTAIERLNGEPHAEGSGVSLS